MSSSTTTLNTTDITDNKVKANIFVIDDQTPQDVAMMQALYSRSGASVTEHLAKVKSSGSGKFMSNFYVGYGHESIGDCGSTTGFIENVSSLAAKAIQDNPMYSGQETSTRYIDMSNRKIIDPIATSESKKILDNWMHFYHNSQTRLAEHIKSIYPRQSTEKETIYNKAINARVFDIMRAFLPAGITTQLSWHTNLRQAADKLATLDHHPDPIIRELSLDIHKELKMRYPESFSHKLYPETEKYRESMSAKYTYFISNKPSPSDIIYDTDFSYRSNIDPAELVDYSDALNTRPIKTKLPIFLADLGTFTFKFLLDFGSFRDIQRHRNGVCRMPLLTTKFGFHEWYLNQMPSDLREQAINLIEHQTNLINNLNCDDIQKQYYVAFGFKVACNITYALPALVYTIELRSGNTVHATLRRIAQQMGQIVKKELPNIALYIDETLDEWDIRRGLQDIVPKQN